MSEPTKRKSELTTLDPAGSGFTPEQTAILDVIHTWDRDLVKTSAQAKIAGFPRPRVPPGPYWYLLEGIAFTIALGHTEANPTPYRLDSLAGAMWLAGMDIATRLLAEREKRQRG